MALKAGYYGVKKQILDELDKLDGILPAGVSKENKLATQSEIDDIWSAQGLLGAKNINGTKYVGKEAQGIIWTVSNGVITANGETSGSSASLADSSPYGFIAPFTSMVKLTGGVSAKIVVFPYDWTDGARPYTDSSKTTRVSGDQIGDTPLTFYMEAGHNYSIIARVKENTSDVVDVELKPALTLLSDPNDVFEPYAMTNQQLTASVSDLTASATDQKTTINAIITAATGAADFAAFKAAMEAITPVTRSLPVEEVREEPEPEPETRTTKRSTKKTTTE